MIYVKRHKSIKTRQDSCFSGWELKVEPLEYEAMHSEKCISTCGSKVCVCSTAVRSARERSGLRVAKAIHGGEAGI
jgi:hypothetical protein